MQIQKEGESLEIEMFDLEIYELECIREQTIKKVLYEVEWFYEVTGEALDFLDVCYRVDEQMEKDWLIYNVTDIFYEECEKTYCDIIDQLFFG